MLRRQTVGFGVVFVVAFVQAVSSTKLHSKANYQSYKPSERQKTTFSEWRRDVDDSMMRSCKAKQSKVVTAKAKKKILGTAEDGHLGSLFRLLRRHDVIQCSSKHC